MVQIMKILIMHFYPALFALSLSGLNILTSTLF